MHKFTFKTHKKMWDVIFIAPALILFSVFTYYPLLINISYSLTSWNGLSAEKEFVGLANFIDIFQNPSVLQAMKNTIYFAVVLLIMGLMFQLSAALIVHSKVKGHNFIKIVLYLPAVLSPIVLAFTWIQFLQYTGYVNQVLEVIGMEESVQNWLLNQDTVKLWLCVIQTLQFIGYGMVFFLTGLNTIPREVDESASLDGAFGIKRFFYITLPLIMPSITVTLFISITGALNTYAIPFALTGGGPNDASTTLTMQIYQRAFGFRQFGYSSALGLVFFVFIAVVSCVQLMVTRKKEVVY